MSNDPNTDRDELNPLDVPTSELDAAIKRAIQKLWDIGFRHHVGEHSTVLTITRNARLLSVYLASRDEAAAGAAVAKPTRTFLSAIPCRRQGVAGGAGGLQNAAFF